MNILCRILGHLPYVEDTPETVHVERQGVKFVIGPMRRYCRRCGVVLEGDEPRVGDQIDLTGTAEGTGDDPALCHLCGKDLSVATIVDHLVREHDIDPDDIANAEVRDST